LRKHGIYELVIVSVVPESVVDISVGVSVVSDIVDEGKFVVEVFSPLHETGKLEGQFGSFGWKHASV
jgi:hypothetical protein